MSTTRDTDEDLIALDALVRQTVLQCLRALPPERRTSASVRRELRRMIRRALADLDDDRRAFTASGPSPAAPDAPAVTGLRHGAPWNAAEDSKLRESFAQDPSLESLARLHGRSVSGIRSRLIKLGLLTPVT